jgi:hypothetical protein
MSMKKLVIIFALASPSLLGQIGGFGVCFGCNTGGTGSSGSSGSYSAPSANYAGTFFLPPGGGVLANSTENLVQATSVIAGPIANFSATVGTTPGGSATLTFTWRKNSSSQVITCTISNPATSCSDLTHSFTVAQGDLVDIMVVGTGSPAATTVVLQWGTPGVAGAAGAIGSTGPGYAATSTTSLTIGTGSKTFATQTGLAYSAGVRARASSASDTTQYMEGIVASYSGSTLVITVDTTNGSGSHADWNLNASGNVGLAGSSGPIGPGYAATSATSITIGTGSISLTTQAGLAYTVGARVRVSSTGGGAYVEGNLVSYSGTSLALIADAVSGSGTFSSWNINLAGAVGATGAGTPGSGNNALCVDATGSTTTYTCPSPSPTVTTLAGLIVTFVPQTTNTGTATLNVNGLGAKTLKAADGATNIASGALIAGTGYIFAYDGTNFRLGAGGGSSAAGSAGAVQSAAGGGSLADSGCTAAGSVMNCTGGFNSGTAFGAGGLWRTVASVPTPVTNGYVIFFNADNAGVFSIMDSTRTVTPVGSGVVLSSSTPLVDSGSGAVGTGTTAARADHVHPTDTSRAAAKPVLLSGYEVGTENASAAFVTADLTNHAFSVTDSISRTLTSATCISDAGSQTVTAKIGSTTLFSITCVAPGSVSGTGGSAGNIIAASMTNTAVAAHSQLDLSGTANATTKDIKLSIYSTPSQNVNVLSYEVGAENATAAFVTADLTNHAAAVNDSNAKTLVEATCISDAGSQNVTAKIGGTTLFTITCVAPGSVSGTGGSAGFIVAGSMTNTAIAANSQVDLSGTANGTTKDVKLFVYGVIN